MDVTVALFTSLLLSAAITSAEDFSVYLNRRSEPSTAGLCANVIQLFGFSCSEHTAQTKDGYILGLQRVASASGKKTGPPVLLIHGLFMAGDAWFMDSPNQSLGFILANRGFDVWVGNVRGTRWSHGHVSLPEKDKKFWDWSWQELALYDLGEMIHYVYSITNSKVFVVGHSQAILDMGIHELNFKSDWGTRIMDMMCDGYLDRDDMLTSITGKNCCFNSSRIDSYLEFEPHPTSSKNLHHLFQMIRKGTFSMYDYGIWKNLMQYNHLKPPVFDLSSIPKSLPIWMGYGGNDALADVADVQHTLKELRSKPNVLYLENYGHLDFLVSTKSKEDVYDSMVAFFSSLGMFGSY